jgi:peptidoglycan-associated lipoprotein
MQTESLSAVLARIATVAAPVAAALALAACASKPVGASAPAPIVSATPAPASARAAAPAATPPVAAPLAAYLDPNSEISQKRSVFFAFDQSTFNDQDKAIVELQGRYLARHPDIHVTVAGNTDERGGSEYNLALGQRRSQTVKTALGLLGVKDDQVEAVSYGKEKPRATGHDEAAWQQNRRADFIYPAK